MEPPKRFRFTDAALRKLPRPTALILYYDQEIPDLCFRITKANARAFVLRYRTGNRDRYLTLGRFSMTSVADWSIAAARTRAAELQGQVRLGADPINQARAERHAPTVAMLAEKFVADYVPKLRPGTQTDYRNQLSHDILPALGKRQLSELRFADIDELHRKKTKTGKLRRANANHSLLRKMFNLAIKWGWLEKNPAIGVERNQEPKRNRYLSAEELSRLTVALAEHRDQQAANIIRLLLLTGCRRGEAQSARWADLDLAQGVWSKPGSATKQKTLHRVPISAPALLLLTTLRNQAEPDAEFVFPSSGARGHRVELKKAWAALCKTAKVNGARLHDLRHTYASILVSSGASLPLIGALLGHSSVQTTARYAHLFDDPLREATERVGAIVTGKPKADVIPLRQSNK